MSVVDRLIYNSLASRRGVNLPGWGSLRVEQSPARLEGNRLIIPAVKVVYSSEPTEGLTDVAALICEVNGGDAAAAESMYQTWKGRREHDGKLSIGGVGEVSGGKFVPEASFDALLNPHRNASAASHRRARTGRRMWVIALPALLGIAVGVGVYLFIDMSGLLGGDDRYVPSVEVAEVTEVATPTAEDSVEPDSSVEAAIERSVKENASAVAEASRTVAAGSGEPVKPAAANAVAGPRYYVVAGVFSTEENADRCIAKIKSELLNVAPEKIPYAGGKILVSLYSTPDAEEATDKMRLWRSWSESLWVYKR